MDATINNPKITTQSWELEQLTLGHNIVEYPDLGKRVAHNPEEKVRLHFGLSGAYDFYYRQLDAKYSLCGHHNNLMYSRGLDLEIENKSHRIETFGVNLAVEYFISIGENGNELLKRFTEQVMAQKQAILSQEWRPNTFRMQQVIGEVLHCPYKGPLQDLFLLSKSIELLVLQAELYSTVPNQPYIKTTADKQKLIAAKELLAARMEAPPTLSELANLVGLNEFKLKKGFKELFGITVFGYLHQHRMTLAHQLLRDTQQSAKEIAYEIGYSSPQHFSKAFKKEFGITPNSIRKTPDFTP